MISRLEIEILNVLCEIFWRDWRDSDRWFLQQWLNAFLYLRFWNWLMPDLFQSGWLTWYRSYSTAYRNARSWHDAEYSGRLCVLRNVQYLSRQKNVHSQPGGNSSNTSDKGKRSPIWPRGSLQANVQRKTARAGADAHCSPLVNTGRHL